MSVNNHLKRIEAKKLYELGGLTQKEIGAKINISEKTIGVWVKKYHWTTRLDKEKNGRAVKDFAIKSIQEIKNKITSENRVPTPAESDSIVKLLRSATILSETSESIDRHIENFIAFIKHDQMFYNEFVERYSKFIFQNN